MSRNTNKTTDDNIKIGPSLLPPERSKTEIEIYTHYMKRFVKLIFIQGPIVAWSIYLVSVFLLSSDKTKELIESKLQFVKDYELQYLYYVVFFIYVVRLQLMANVNGARAPTRLDRPDQHIYQVIGSNDLVLMANDGVNGRFNRAQRAINNMDEGLSLFLVNALLVAPIFGKVVFFLFIPLYGYGRISFGRDYKDSLRGRQRGFMLSMYAEHGMAAFVALIAIKVTML